MTEEIGELLKLQFMILLLDQQRYQIANIIRLKAVAVHFDLKLRLNYFLFCRTPTNDTVNYHRHLVRQKKMGIANYLPLIMAHIKRPYTD